MLRSRIHISKKQHAQLKDFFKFDAVTDFEQTNNKIYHNFQKILTDYRVTTQQKSKAIIMYNFIFKGLYKNYLD